MVGVPLKAAVTDLVRGTRAGRAVRHIVQSVRKAILVLIDVQTSVAGELLRVTRCQHAQAYREARFLLSQNQVVHIQRQECIHEVSHFEIISNTFSAKICASSEVGLRFESKEKFSQK